MKPPGIQGRDRKASPVTVIGVPACTAKPVSDNFLKIVFRLFEISRGGLGEQGSPGGSPR